MKHRSFKHFILPALMLITPGLALAQNNISDSEMENIKQYCEEINVADRFEDEASRNVAIAECVQSEIDMYSQAPQE